MNAGMNIAKAASGGPEAPVQANPMQGNPMEENPMGGGQMPGFTVPMGGYPGKIQ